MKRTSQIRILISLIFLTFTSSGHALIQFEDAVNPELAVSGRALAMGNAFISKVDDSTAVVYNPAGLGTVRKTHLHLSNFFFELNKGFMQMGTGGKASDAIDNFTDSFELEGIRNLLLKSPGKISHSRFSFMPNFTTRFFSVGYLVSKQTKATIGLQSNALFEFADRLDHGPYFGMNLSLLGGIFKLGATVMYINRKELIGEQSKSLEFKEDDQVFDKGSGIFLTTGAKLTIPWAMLPTFSAVVHNTTTTEFDIEGGDRPTKIERSVSVGFSLTPQIGKTTRVHMEVNYKDLADQYPGVSGQRKTTFGIEIDFFRTIFIRGGYGDGFGSAGLGLKTQKLEFDITTYAVDSTSSEFRGVEDRRFAIGFSSGF